MCVESTPKATVAAFFDIDGTILPGPSLEMRLFRSLRSQRAIPLRNYAAWLRGAFQLLPRGLHSVKNENKLYLRGVPARYTRLPCNRHNGGPQFFPQALDRIRWHVRAGHQIVLVSGTLLPLAQEVALSLADHFETPVAIDLCATQLEERNGRWTGRVVGQPLFGKAKGIAVRQWAQNHNLSETNCYAYGNTVTDHWMLESVGEPVAVNPTRSLQRMASRRNWQVLHWKAPHAS